MAASACCLFLLCVVMAGCSSVSDMISSSSSSPASTAPAAASGAASATVEPAADDLPCPDVSVRTGASTLMITAKGAAAADATALDLRYQGSIIRTGRECRVAGGNMTMKVGVEGRLITGPAGGAGQVDVPLRLAVVREGPEPRVVMSKLARVSVAVEAGQDFANFTHIDPEISFPLPRPLGELDAYVVYVGFDTQALAAEKPKPKPRRKR